jgi:hypothetical protein
MDLFDKLFKRKESIDLDETPVEEKVTTSRPIKINKAKIKDFVVKAIGAIANQSDSRERFERPEYNL